MNLVAMLLFSGLMPMHLVFFIDGAPILKTLIEEYFGYCCYQIDMDWYHAKRNIANLIRQGAAGSKKEKEDAVRQALNCLWLYDLNGLKELIARLNKQPEANHDKLKTAMGYLQRKMPNLTCYSLRKELNRTLSSATVEKYNDLLVAERQKHSIASWSLIGSNTQAQLQAAYFNGHLTDLGTNFDHIEWFKAA